MEKTYDAVDGKLADRIRRQRLFFVEPVGDSCGYGLPGMGG